MTYPGQTHALSEGTGASCHLYCLLTRYLEGHLPRGAGEPIIESGD